MNWKGILWMARKALSKNKPAVLFGTGVVCLGACAVLTAKATPTAASRVYVIESEVGDIIWPDSMENDEIQRKCLVEKAKRVVLEAGPVYIPAAVAGIAAVSAFALSNKQLSKQAAGAIAACTVAEKALGAYQDNVIKELGEEVHDRILKGIVDDVPDEVMEKADGYLKDSDVANRFPPEMNDKLYYDHVTGRMFWSSDEKIKDAESTVNKLLIDVGMATINDFYSALLLDCDSVIGDAIGWRIEDPHARNMDVIFGSRLDRENNTPLITIGYRTCAVNLRELERR